MAGALLSSAILMGSCSEDELPTYSDMALDKTEITIDLNSGVATGEVTVTQGNGNYKVVVADEGVATAVTDGSKVLFTGVQEGETTATVTDWARKSANVTVKVIGQMAAE